MKRLEIGKKNIKTLPISFNSVDFDLTFDADNISVTTGILDMAEMIEAYEKDGIELSKKKPVIKEIKAFAQRGIDLCKTLSNHMGEIFDEWANLVGNNFLKLTDYEAIIMALADIIHSRKIEKKVEKEMEEER